MPVKSTLTQVREYFKADGGTPLSMAELKEIKDADGGKHWEQLTEGITNGTLTY